MFNIGQAIFALLSLSTYFRQAPVHVSGGHGPKSIAIIGAGSGGLAMLKTLLDIPESVRSTWTIVLYEHRNDVGGVWLPEPQPLPPPVIPNTALYPLLRSNTPVPSMTYPGLPFPPNTSLYPSHKHIEAYHTRYALHFNLSQNIRFRHTVLQASWKGTPTLGYWNLTVHDERNTTRHEAFDHVVVATGNNHFPRIPTWAGQQDWLNHNPSDSPKREILHSAWYRGPERYTGRRVLIVGLGASGRDVASQIYLHAQETYASIRHPPDPKDGTVPDGVHVKPEVSHFTTDTVVFKDGTESIIDAILLGTGYEIRKPFLDEGEVLITDPSAHSNLSQSRRLVTNLRYIFPLYKHILSLSPLYPTNALAFIGLPSAIANCPSDVAQSLFVTHAILDHRILPPRHELLKDLALQEETLRQKGYDPYRLGHQLPPGTSSDYQDDLVAFLKLKRVLPNDGKNFVEGWRREILAFNYLKRGWKRIELLGKEAEWLAGVETEEDWSNLMRHINSWQEDWENFQGIPFVRDWDLGG